MDTVTSADGTAIAVSTAGDGPAVLLVGTTLSDHHGLDGIAGLLAERFTVVNYDRRGRGASGDTAPYAPAREVEDIAAVLDTVGRPALLVSGSAGCVLALDAASALGDRVGGLYLYEPPFIVGQGRPPMPADFVEHVEALVGEGRRSDAVAYFMTEGIGVPAEFLEGMQADPSWAVMASYAHTLGYDGRIVAGTQDGRPLPTDRWRIAVPTIAAVGENSEPFFHEGARALADLLPTARYLVLPGQDHSALWTAPGALVDSIAQTLVSTPSR
jgi:pimeloyl-ACP methyl ester carboxylesterase